MNINAYFTLSGEPATGLSPTVSAVKVADGTVVVTDAAMTELALGWYTYDFSAAVAGQEYVFTANAGTDTIDDRYPAASSGVTALSIADAVWASTAGTQLINDILFLSKTLKNKREIKKVGATWSLVIYDDNGTTPIISKALKDFNGAEIADLASGVLAAEGASSV